jgi:hypothetical protein
LGSNICACGQNHPRRFSARHDSYLHTICVASKEGRLVNAALLDASVDQLPLRLPRYVLLFDKQRIGPAIAEKEIAAHSVVIYGFSDEHCYGRFIARSGRRLTPFPLVKTYLRDQLSDHQNSLKLIVVDAEDAAQVTLRAVTMQAVLGAFENLLEHVNTSHLLTYTELSKAYAF